MKHNNGKHVEVNTNIGKVHEYLGMNFYFTEKGQVKIKIGYYFEMMINEVLMKISKCNTALTPAGNNIFEKDNTKRLGKK